MDYKEVCVKIKKMEWNLERAVKRGATQKVKRYKNMIIELKAQKKNLELNNTGNVLKDQDEIIKKLQSENEDYKKTTNRLEEKIEKMQEAINIMTSLPGTLEEPEKEDLEPTLNCPRCGKPVLESQMPEHQKNCLSSRQ